MSKRQTLVDALGWIVILAFVAGLLWCFVPRPMMKGELRMVRRWDGQTLVSLTDQVDPEAVRDVVEGFQRNYGGRKGGYSLDEYPLQLGFDYPGGSWCVEAGPNGAYVSDSGEDSVWRLLDGKRLWQELAPLIPEV